MAKFKTLQNPWAEGLGNDYEQDLSYVVEYVDKDGKKTTKDAKGAKSTWRDGIYTKLAYDIKDPKGYNKRTVNIPQSAWGDAFDTIPVSAYSAMSGETDGSALFTSGYATAVSFFEPFDDGTKYQAAFNKANTEYYTDTDTVKVPQGIDVAEFRQVKAST